MIIGLGIDLTDMRAVDSNFDAFKVRLTEAELKRCYLKDGIPCIARKHAAKEAVMKALGGNDALGNVAYTDIELSNSLSGRPLVALKNSALSQLNAITPAGHAASVHISITDDVPVAAAVCIIEAFRT